MMRTKLSITEGIFPMPVLMVATYNEDGSVNVMNAAWGTMQERETVVLNLTETHKTVKNIKPAPGLKPARQAAKMAGNSAPVRRRYRYYPVW